MGAFIADSASLSLRCLSASALTSIADHSVRHFQCAISTFLTKQPGFKRRDAQTGAIILIQRFGSAANLNIHLHCLILDGVYRIQNGVAEFHPVHSPTNEQPQWLLSQIVTRVLKALTRHGVLIEEA